MIRILSIIIVLFPLLAIASTWTPIIGIPDPGVLYSWNVVDLYGSGSGATYDYSDDEEGAITYRLNVNNEPYTYYIDADDVNSTNTDNPHGTESVPRITRPNPGSYIPGDVVEIHGATAMLGLGGFDDSGTAEKPIFIRGTATDKPITTYTFGRIEGDYIVIENIKFDMNLNDNPIVYWGLYNIATTHTVFRNNEIYNCEKDPGSSIQMMRSKNDTVELMPNSNDKSVTTPNAWADVDLVSGGGSFSNDGALILASGSSGVGDYCTLPVASYPMTNGETYRFTAYTGDGSDGGEDINTFAGTWVVKSFDGTQTFGTITSRATPFVIDFTAEAHGGGLRIEAGSNNAKIHMDNFTLGDRPTTRNENILIDNNIFRELGDENDGDADVVVVSIDTNTRYVWITNNTAYDIGGDFVQVAYDGFRYGGYIPQYIYIGKNTAHDMYENMIDLKVAQDVIVSQNTAYNFGPAYSNLSKDGNGPFRFGLGEGPQNINKNNFWILFNYAYNIDPLGSHCVYTIFDYAVGAEPYGPRYAEEVYFIGNVLADYSASDPADVCDGEGDPYPSCTGDGTGDGYSFGFCGSQLKSGGFFNNIVYNGATALRYIGDRDDTYTSESVSFINNIVHTTSDNMIEFFGTEDSFNNWTMSNNIFYSTNDGTIDYTNYDVSPTPVELADLDAFIAKFNGTDGFPNFGVGTVGDNPDFASPGTNNFHLQADSPAIDNGTLNAAFATFKARYGIDIDVDFDGVSIPQGTAQDIGAYEYIEANIIGVTLSPGVSISN